MLTRQRAVATAALLAAVALPGRAAAADDPAGAEGCGLYVCVEANSPSKPGDNAAGQQAASGGKGKANPMVCTYKRADPQPPAGSLDWEGHKPGDGAVYEKTCRFKNSDDFATVTNVWAADPPEAGVAPEVLAQRAVDKMLLKGPDVASPRAGGKYTVGVPMWLWVNEGATTFGPTSATATAGAVTVTATAEVTGIEWDLGDGGDVVYCDGPGTPYKRSYGMKESPDCGTQFETPSKGEPGGKYQGTATATWTVEWQVNGGGEAGEFTEVRDTEFAVAVGELKVLD